jgi:hypothetical protein
MNIYYKKIVLYYFKNLIINIEQFDGDSVYDLMEWSKQYLTVSPEKVFTTLDPLKKRGFGQTPPTLNLFYSRSFNINFFSPLDFSNPSPL